MRLALAAAVILLIAIPAEARHHRHHYRHYAHEQCLPGAIWLRHERECVWKHSRREVMPIDTNRTRTTDTRPSAKREDRLPAADPGPGITLPFWEPYPIMGRPQGRWWML